MNLRATRYAFVAAAIALAAACSSSSSPNGGPSGVGPGGPVVDGGAGSEGGTNVAGDGGSTPASPCATDKSAGTHKLVCEGFELALAIPASCPDAGCGLILDLHGALMSGDLEDAHDELRKKGGAKGYVVVQPTGPKRTYQNFTGPQWFNSDDDALVRIVETLVKELAIDSHRVHVTGFSQGGFATLRLLCKRADLFASVAAGAAGSDGCPLEKEFVGACPFSGDAKPSRAIDVLFMYGRKDAVVPKECAQESIAAIAKGFALAAPTTLASESDWARKRYAGTGVVMETLEHDWAAGGSLSFNGGHCVPGSKAATGSVWDDLACTGDNAFVWGEEVLSFFENHAR